MDTASQSTLNSRLRLLSEMLTAGAMVYASLILAGWLFGVPALKEPVPGEGLASATSALAVILTGISLRLLPRAPRAPGLRIESTLYALGALATGILGLFLTIPDLHQAVSQFFLGPQSSPAPISFIGPPSITGSLAVTFLSASALLLPVPSRWALGFAAALSMFTFLFCVLVVTVCLYGGAWSLAAGELIHMTLPDSLAFAALSAAILLSRPDAGLPALLASTNKGGHIARRALSLTLLVPLLAGFLTVLGQTAGLYAPSFGAAVVVVSCIAFSTALLWFVAKRLDRSDAAHLQTESALQQLAEQTRFTFDTICEAFIAMSSSGVITDWNKEAERIFGWPREDAIGRSFSDTVIPAHLRDHYQQRMLALQTSGEIPFLNKQLEVQVVHRDGHEFPVELSISPVRTGGAFRMYAFARDVSERNRLAKELADARDQAVEASKLKSEFLANMSHEIRTPLNAIIGMSDLILRRHLSDELRDYAVTIHDSGEVLLTIVNDILDYSKIEAGKLSLEMTDIDTVSLVEGTAELAAGRAREKGLSLSTFIAGDIPPVLRGDPGRIRQVLLNFMANSIKFTESGEVIVRATAERAENDTVVIRFSVADTGIGIAEDVLFRMFEPFTQADGSVTRKYGGTGLGLSISKRLVEMMGGQIGAESDVGQGSHFWFTVPLERPAKRAQVSPSRLVFHDVRLLVVDGPPGASEIIEAYAASWGIHCGKVATAEEALHVLRREAAANAAIDLAIVDFELTYSDALSLAQSVRRYADLADTKLILVSSFDDREMVSEALKAGYAAYLTKPVRQSRLYDCIVSVLTKDSEREQVTAAPAQVSNEDKGPPPDPDKLVLVVEDNAVNQKVALLQLEELGYVAHAVGNGFEALEALSRTDYALLFMDCQMPEMDGFETTRRIRTNEARTGKHVPIIAMTAHAMSEDRYKCLSAGMDDYVSKPVTRRKLREVLTRHLPKGTPPENPSNGDPPEEQVRPASAGEQPIDFATLAESLGEYDAREIVGTFMRTCGASIERIDAALRGRNVEEIKSVVHELKGATRAILATEMARACVEVEEAIADEHWGRIQEGCASLKLAFGRLRAFLQENLLSATSEPRAI